MKGSKKLPYRIQELEKCTFSVASDGITYTPLCGSGDEKDLDFFITWEELRVIFMHEREIYKYPLRKYTPPMSDGEEHGTDYSNE